MAGEIDLAVVSCDTLTDENVRLKKETSSGRHRAITAW
jgi:hypothetical protein